MGFGYSTSVFGEIVFNTGMVGYTEALTDPSYNGQILTLTYPLVGNYGVPDSTEVDNDGISKFFESDMMQIRGLVVHELSQTASHWNLKMTLDEWMYNEQVPGISGIDTREITKTLTSSGVMMAALVVSDEEIDVEKVKKELTNVTKYNSEKFMDIVSTKEEKIYGDDTQSVVIIDTGAKNAIVRNVRELGYSAIVVPWNTSFDKVMSYNPKGVILSSGPGDPKNCPETVDTAKKLIENNIPTLGICLGAQIIEIDVSKI